MSLIALAVGLGVQKYQDHKEKKANAATAALREQQDPAYSGPAGLSAASASGSTSRSRSRSAQRSVAVPSVSTYRPYQDEDLAGDVPPPYEEAVKHHPQRADHPQRAEYPQRADHPQHVDHPQRAVVADEHNSEVEDEDEEDWARDDTQDQLPAGEEQHPNQSSTLASLFNGPQGVERFVANFLHQHPAPPVGTTYPLDYPVVLPQRRPQSRSRGFVRAYAPELMEAGVDQAAFLDFLDGFEAGAKGEGVFYAANVATLMSSVSVAAATALPTPFVLLTSLAIQLTIDTSRRGYESNKINTYLDSMNASIFHTRGLHVMIMTYDPHSPTAHQPINTLTMRAIGGPHSQDHQQHNLSNLHASSAHATEFQIPESAPLVFPALEAASEEHKANAFSRASAFTKDYMDRRARTESEAEHPDSALAGSGHAGLSGAADSTHPMWNNGVLGLLSDERRQGVRARHGRAGLGRSRGVQPSQHGDGGRQGDTAVGAVKRKLGRGVLYLMVVNMPSEAELEQAAALLRGQQGT